MKNSYEPEDGNESLVFRENGNIIKQSLYEKLLGNSYLFDLLNQKEYSKHKNEKHKLSDKVLNISLDLSKEKDDKNINQNNKLFQEIKNETSIINKKRYKFFDKPVDNIIEKYYYVPPIFKRFGKNYTEKR